MAAALEGRRCGAICRVLCVCAVVCVACVACVECVYCGLRLFIRRAGLLLAPRAAPLIDARAGDASRLPLPLPLPLPPAAPTAAPAAMMEARVRTGEGSRLPLEPITVMDARVRAGDGSRLRLVGVLLPEPARELGPEPEPLPAPLPAPLPLPPVTPVLKVLVVDAMIG